MATIPVIIDSVGTEGLTRCLYFQIEGEDASGVWGLGLGRSTSLPFLMIELVGVIYRPLNADPLFSDPLQFDQILNVVEGDIEGHPEAVFSVEISDLWLPSHLLKYKSEAPKRYDVWRVDEKLFRLAVAFRYGRLPIEQFVRLEQTRESTLYSPEEAKVFWDWSKNQISMSRNRSNPELELSADGPEMTR